MSFQGLSRLIHLKKIKVTELSFSVFCVWAFLFDFLTNIFLFPVIYPVLLLFSVSASFFIPPLVLLLCILHNRNIPGEMFCDCVNDYVTQFYFLSSVLFCF